MTLTQLLATVFVFGIVVTVHELGHFITAKMVGMKVEEFAIGFGPKIFSIQRGETLYSLRGIPLGGFNKIAGMDAEEELDDRSYLNQPIWKRMIVIVAGSAMNLILPVLLLFFLYVGAGVERPLIDSAVIGEVIEGRAAAYAGVLPDDKVVGVNDQKIKTWDDMTQAIQKVPAGESAELLIIRDGIQMKVLIAPEFDEAAKRSLIGVTAKTELIRTGVLEGIELSFKQTAFMITAIIGGLYQMISGTVGVELSGPIGVAQAAGAVVDRGGFIALLGFTAFLSINLGLVNLFPIPALDGGHLLVLIVEARFTP